MAVRYCLRSKYDDITSYQVEMGSKLVWFRFIRDLTDEEKMLLATVATVGTLEAIRALELPFWDASGHGGPSWVNID